MKVEVGYDLSALLAAAYRQPIAFFVHPFLFSQQVGDLYHAPDEG